MRTMTKYTPEQRLVAVRMLNECGAQRTQEALGIPPTTLYRWKKQLEEEKENLVYSVLCLLKCAQYCKEIPGCAEMKFDDLVAKIVPDVVEELILLHLNRDDVIEDPATHP